MILPENVLLSPDAAKYLDIGLDRLRRLAKKGIIPSIQYADRSVRLYRVEDLDQYQLQLEKQKP